MRFLTSTSLFFVLLVSLLISCSAKKNYKPTSLQILTSGSDMSSIKCKFQPPVQEIEFFFEDSVEISSKEEHQIYGWSPCFVKGYVEWQNQNWEFKLRPTGSATLFDQNNRIKIIGNLKSSSQLKVYLK